MSTPSMTQLSARIGENTAKVNAYLASHDLPGPSFEVDAPQQLLPPGTDAEMVLARQSVIDDCLELRNLLLGPREHIMTTHQAINLVSPKAITAFRLAHAFPVGSETTFAELAAASGLGETHVRKLVRHAVSVHNLFAEPRPGVITHSAASRLLAEDDAVHSWVEYATHELWDAAFHAPDAMRRFPGSGEPNETGFSVANATDKSFFAFMSDHPDRLRRFAAVMRYITQRPELGPELVVGAFPWGELPAGGTVVDVGGSHGLVCIELASKFPTLKFVVQDLDEPVIRDADARKPAEVADRVTFMAHNFFNPQPVHGADVYFVRAVLHNWSDKYAVEVLRNLIPALKPGAAVVVNDVVTPEAGSVPKVAERQFRISDLSQVLLLNAGDRELAGWTSLFGAADPRFKFKGAAPMPGSTRMWMIHYVWEDA
ncbi:putative O-methyltransferase [Lasiosphaeris hirsuta]|uniref:O-methyltransferase n=1 Tax=Lasiosphaeris hirsuta TaxID=260670 RepID=A0AA39ZXT9_9PEZI|nr:putative O-methyltransferase [Lasiosphaeris hirsuta]